MSVWKISRNFGSFRNLEVTRVVARGVASVLDSYFGLERTVVERDRDLGDGRKRRKLQKVGVGASGGRCRPSPHHLLNLYQTISSSCTELSLLDKYLYLMFQTISSWSTKLSEPAIPICLYHLCKIIQLCTNYKCKKTVTGIAPSHHPTVQHATLLFRDKTRYLETYHFIAIQCNPLDLFCHVCHQCQEQNTEKDYDKKIRKELTIIIPDDDHGNRDGDDDDEIGRWTRDGIYGHDSPSLRTMLNFVLQDGVHQKLSTSTSSLSSSSSSSSSWQRWHHHQAALYVVIVHPDYQT